jgi:hypothetical protein
MNADPTAIKSIAITAEDLVAALEARHRSDRETVLRITPPFSGRMRARLHEPGYDDDSGPIHVEPERLVTSVPDYPTPADTEDRLRADPDETYSRDRHREFHESVVADWRATVRENVRESVVLPTPAGDHEVTVSLLG